MSLLDRRPETVVVYPSRDVVDTEFGSRRREAGNPELPGLEAAVWIVRPKSELAAAPGYDTTERRQLIARNFPYGAATVVRYEDRLWDVIDEPLPRRVTARTTHTSCTIEARTGVPRG